MQSSIVEELNYMVMIRQNVDIKDTAVFVAGQSRYARNLSGTFRERGYRAVTLVNDQEKPGLPTTIRVRVERDDQICLAVYFIDDIREMRTVQELTGISSCGVFPIVAGEETDLTLILLQKTDIKDVEHIPFSTENLLLKVEKLLIRIHMQKRIIASHRQNRDFFLKILKVMAKLLEERDEYTEHHSENVARIACAIAAKHGFSVEELNKLEMAGLLHDFGKIGITDKILNKPDKLTNEEYEVVKRHPSIAQVILEPVQDLQEIIPWIKHHHEKYNGRGYPDNLKGEEIPFAARILAVADAYDTMASKRTYHDPFEADYIRKELINNKGEQFDPVLVDTFIEILDSNGLDLGPREETT